MAPPRRAAGVLAVALATLAALSTGCGSTSSSGTAADPASAVPASAALYAGAIVRPGGALKSASLAAGRTLTRQADPYLNLVRLLQTPGSPTIDFSRDVAPWLGERAGVFLGSLGSSDQSMLAQLFSLIQQGLLGGPSSGAGFPFAGQGLGGAIVLDTRDAARARSFLDSQAARAGGHALAYRGVAYHAVSGGVASAIVDRFAVIGTESGVRSVIDTTQGGAQLLHSPGYSTLAAAVPSGALAHLYAKPGAVAAPGAAHPGAGARTRPPQGLAQLLGLLAGARALNVSLEPSSTALALDADALSTGSAAASGGLLASAGEGAGTLAELPGDSWLALGLGNVGATLGEDVQGLRSLLSLAGSTPEAPASSSLSVKGLLDAFLTPLVALGANGGEAAHALQGWMGSAGIFASGSGLLELKGGVVITSKNPALSRAAVGRLGGLLAKSGAAVSAAPIPGTEASIAVRLSGLPVALDIAAGRAASGQSKFVIGLGEGSVATALNPPTTMSSSASYAAARAALGEGIQPSLIVQTPTLLSLLEGVGLTEDPTISKLVPTLRSLGTLTGGGRSLGGALGRFRLVLGLQAG